MVEESSEQSLDSLESSKLRKREDDRRSFDDLWNWMTGFELTSEKVGGYGGFMPESDGFLGV